MAGVPVTWNVPASLSSVMSASSASSSLAASLRALLTSSAAAFHTAAPPCCSEREPIVPAPWGTRSVSPQTTLILSIGMPVCSLASMLQDVTWPWPCGEVPV